MIDERFKREAYHLEQLRRRQQAEALEIEAAAIERLTDAIEGCWRTVVQAGTLDRQTISTSFESAVRNSGFITEPLAAAALCSEASC
jgi:hypothetical protein